MYGEQCETMCYATTSAAGDEKTSVTTMPPLAPHISTMRNTRFDIPAAEAKNDYLTES